MNSIQLFGAVEIGLIYSLVAVGIYLSFRILQFPDLTVDGSYPLGAAVCAILITEGYSPLFATTCAIASGACAGFLTAWISTQMRILNLLAGILIMTALYSINIRVMGRPNIALLGEETLFSQWLSDYPHIVTLTLIVLFFTILTYAFLKTQVGLALRATGSNSRMGRAQGIRDHWMIWLGLSFANALSALAGSLYAQLHSFADVTMGVGTIIIGLASVIIGESIFPTRTVWQALVACIFGAIVFRIIYALALNAGAQASDLNLVTVLIVLAAISLPHVKQKILQDRGI